MRGHVVATLRLQLPLLLLLMLLAIPTTSDDNCAGNREGIRCVVDQSAYNSNAVGSGAGPSPNDSSTGVGELPDLDHRWGYDQDNGPARWPQTAPGCGGRWQSPIALDTTMAQSRHQPRLHWFGWHNLPVIQVVANNGHTVSLTSTYLSDKDVPQVWFSGSDQRYRLDNVHFHWGGSEHTLNGERFTMEMHVVTYDKRYSSMKKAMTQKNGILVLGYFFRASAQRNAPLQEQLVRHLGTVVRPQSKHLLARPLRLSRLVHPFEKSFLLYQGSLTTPPCQQTVRWVLSKDVRSVSRKQLAQLARIQNQRGKPMGRNWRPLQPLNGRTVTHVF